MATLVENAIRIKETFDDIYDAIVDKGVTPIGDVTTYAEAIDEIPAGESTPLIRRLYYYGLNRRQSSSTYTETFSYKLTYDTELFIEAYASLGGGRTVGISVSVNGVVLNPISSFSIGLFSGYQYSAQGAKGNTVNISFTIPGTSSTKYTAYGTLIIWGEN